MSQITASCPNCQAQYQLSPEQLSVAHGKVRCGACMTVFQASPAPVKAAPPPPPRPAPERTQRSAFINQSDEQQLGSKAKRPVDDDLIMDDVEENSFISKSGQVAVEFSEEFDNVLKEDGLLNSQGRLADDEAWAEQLLEDIADEPETPKLGAKKAEKAKEVDPFAADLEGLDISLELTADEEEALGAFKKDDLRHRIQPEPLEFAMASRRRAVWLNIGLVLVAIVAIAGIAAQLLYFQFDSLARDPAWRNSYAVICEKLGCTLPDQFKLHDIQASHLAVKTHPHYTQSLMVDVIITNHADIDQPFPNIELFFTNTANQVVAARKFEPDEYLRGELRHARLMPRRQPLHLALEIDDPGRAAAGYRMQLSY